MFARGLEALGDRLVDAIDRRGAEADRGDVRHPATELIRGSLERLRVAAREDNGAATLCREDLDNFSCDVRSATQDDDRLGVPERVVHELSDPWGSDRWESEPTS